jgi:hypothetical protein
MKSYLRIFLILILVFSVKLTVQGEHVRGKRLAEKLPLTETILYCEIDTKQIIESSVKSLEVLGEAKGKEVVANIKKLKGLLEKMAEQEQQFAPKIFKELDSLNFYIVGLKTKFEAHVNNPEKLMEPFLVLETSSKEVASNFITEVFALSQRMKQPVKKTVVGKGVLLTADLPNAEMGFSGGLGALDNFVILGMGDFGSFYKTLSTDTLVTFASNELYKKYRATKKTEHLYVYFDPKPYIAIGKTMAKADPNFESIFTALSLDSLSAIEVILSSDVTKNSVKSATSFRMHHDKPLGKLLTSVLNGGPALNMPSSKKGLSVMARADVKTLVQSIIEEVVKGKSAEEKKAIMQEIDGQKASLGIDIKNLGDTFPGDLYFFVDITEKDYMEMEFDEKTQQVIEVKKRGKRPDLNLVLGTTGEAKGKKALKDLFASPMFRGAPVQIEIYKKETIYVLGMMDPNNKTRPNGLQSYAIAATGNHLTMGSWEKVTGMIDKVKSGAAITADAVIKKHEKDNFLFKAPNKFYLDIQNFMMGMIPMPGAQPGKNMMDVAKEQMIKDLVRDLKKMPSKDAKLKGEITTTITEIVETLFTMGIESYGGDGIFYGHLQDGYYELSADSEAKKSYAILKEIK